MGTHRKWVQTIILAAVVLVGGYAIAQSLFMNHKTPREGDKAPGFSLLGTDNVKHDLSEYKGKVVVINFWGSFCEPCKDEMPAIQKQFEKWSPQGLVVLGVNLGESGVTVKSFVQQYQLTFPILYDPELDIRNRYGVIQYPTTFFVNRTGKIEAIQVGEMQESFLESTLARMMASGK